MSDRSIAIPARTSFSMILDDPTMTVTPSSCADSIDESLAVINLFLPS